MLVMHPVCRRPKHPDKSANRHRLEQFANFVTWWARPAPPVFSPLCPPDTDMSQRQGRPVVPGLRVLARTIARSIRSCWPQPTTQRAAEILTLDDAHIDASDSTASHRVRGDLCRSRRPKAVGRCIRQFSQRSTDRCRPSCGYGSLPRFRRRNSVKGSLRLPGANVSDQPETAKSR